jgi:hypothetical protein
MNRLQKSLTHSYRPVPSPLKAEFQKLGLTAGAVAVYIRRSHTHTLNMLNGVNPIPAEVETKMKELVEIVKADRKHQDASRLDEASLV